MDQHIGVATARKVDELRIRWPSNNQSEQVFRNVPVDQRYSVREGSSALAPIKRKTLTLGQTALRPEDMSSHHMQ